jgi:hypothetical protein
MRTISTAWHNRVYGRVSCRLCLIPADWKRRREREPTSPGCRASSAGLMVRILLAPAASLRTLGHRAAVETRVHSVTVELDFVQPRGPSGAWSTSSVSCGRIHWGRGGGSVRRRRATPCATPAVSRG